MRFKTRSFNEFLQGLQLMREGLKFIHEVPNKKTAKLNKSLACHFFKSADFKQLLLESAELRELLLLYLQTTELWSVRRK